MLFVPLHSFLTERDNDNLLYLKLGGKKDIRSLYSSDLKQTHGEVRRWLLNNQTHQLANLAFINHRQQNTKGGGRQIVTNSPFCLWNWNTFPHSGQFLLKEENLGTFPYSFIFLGSHYIPSIWVYHRNSTSYLQHNKISCPHSVPSFPKVDFHLSYVEGGDHYFLLKDVSMAVPANMEA